MSFDNRGSAVDGASGSANSAEIQSILLCKTGCGFYANQSFDGMCSKCYKDSVVLQLHSSPSGVSPSSESYLDVSSSTSEEIMQASGNLEAVQAASIETGVPTVLNIKQRQERKTLLEGPTSADPASSAGKPKRSRCLTCKKKVGLLGFSCRCEGLFCATHRYSDKHDCSFDYREHGQDLLRKHNPKIVAEKVQKI